MSEEINCLIGVVKEAGEFLKNNFGKELIIESKGDRNLVTQIDKKTQDIIVSRILDKYPHWGILAEESFKKDLDNDYLCIIDPIDGTHNFIRNIEIFGISVGVIYKKEFVMGIIYMPISDELYVGEKNNGAYKNGQKIRVSNISNLKESSISFDSSIRYAPSRMLKCLGTLAKNVFNIRMLGSSVRVLSYISEGKLDCAIEFYDRIWDFAGGVCIVKEAGGIFVDFEGNAPNVKTLGYIACNASLYEKISLLLKEPYSIDLE